MQHFFWRGHFQYVVFGNQYFDSKKFVNFVDKKISGRVPFQPKRSVLMTHLFRSSFDPTVRTGPVHYGTKGRRFELSDFEIFFVFCRLRPFMFLPAEEFQRKNLEFKVE